MSTAVVEVLDTPTEMELLLEFDREHRAVEECLTDALTHALRAGEILLALRERYEQDGKNWITWLKESGPCSTSTASTYMRLARYKDQIPAGASIGQARRLLIGAPPIATKGSRGLPEVRQRALELIEEGWTHAAAAAEVGVAQTTVTRWRNPDQAEVRRKSAEAMRRSRERKLAAQEQAKNTEIKRAVRKAGAATQEAWAMAERFQDVIAQAHDETKDREARAALARAGEHYRKMRDEIVRALGVQ